jgi:hypothetical protein
MAGCRISKIARTVNVHQAVEGKIMKNVLVIALFIALSAFSNAANKDGGSSPIKHVLLISIDGAHALDVQNFVHDHPDSAIAQLQRRGVTFTNARQPMLGDSTPGLLSIVTGGSPATTGLIYSPLYARDLSPPGSDCSTRGTVYYIDEKWVKDMSREDSGGGIDPAKLARDPARSCAAVYPHHLLRVNTMFEVVRASGRRTAWVDQHEMYNDLAKGPSGEGLDESVALERKGVPQTAAGFMAQDQRRVDIVSRQIRGQDARGKVVGTPAVFGMGFISFGAVQKSAGYADAEGKFSPTLDQVMSFVDRSLLRLTTDLKERRLFDSTMIIVTAKHGQSPIDIRQRRVIDRKLVRDTVNSVSPDLLAHASLDSIGLLYLADPTKTAAVAQALRVRATDLGILRVYSGRSLELLLPANEPRFPDLVIQPTLGVFYTEGVENEATRALLAEHGGMLDEDVQVPLIVSGVAQQGQINRSTVLTSQIAPTILKALGLDPARLDAVRREGTAVLPSLR